MNISTASRALEEIENSPEFEGAVGALVKTTRALSGCESVSLRLLTEEGWLPFVHCEGFPPRFVQDEGIIENGECMCGRVASARTEPLLPFFTAGGSFFTNDTDRLVRDFTTEQLGQVRGRCILEGYKTVAAFPIRSEGRVMGVLHLTSREKERLTPAALEAIEAICARAGGPLLSPSFAAHREERVLSCLTQALFPQPPERLGGLEIGFAWRGATAVDVIGGDFCDVIPLTESRTGVIVGDFCGRGISVAGYAARCRLALADLFSTVRDPALTLTEANASLVSHLPEGTFSTALCALFDTASGELSLSLAGHPWPLMVEGCRSVERVGHNALPLALHESARYETSTMRFGPRDTFVAFTDGIIEARAGAASFFEPLIADLCLELAALPPAEMAQSICRRSESFAARGTQQDDRLVIVIRRKG